MPWTAADADKHVKGLSAKQKRAWSQIANSALARCQADGGSNCDASAIKQANAAAQRIKESALALSEVGKEFSSKNAAAMGQAMDALRGAVTALQALLDRAAATKDTAPATEALRILSEAEALLEAADLSFSDRERLLRDALRSDAGGANTYVYLRDCFEDFCVYSVETGLGESGLTLFKRSYSIVDGKVTLGDAAKVQVVTTYVPVAEAQADAGLWGRLGGAITAAVESVMGRTRESAAELEITGDVIPLVEKAVRRDGTIPVKLIQPGWGSSGYYPKDVLKRDGPKVFTKGLHSYWNHPSKTEEADRPERDLRDLAGVFESGARWEDEGAAGPGLYADLKVFEGFTGAVEQLAPHIGVSIRGRGIGQEAEADGRSGKVISKLLDAQSVDFVTAPGAGGQILSLFEAARGRATHSPEGGDAVTTEEAQQLREANTAMGQQLEQTRTELARMRERELLREAQAVAAATLAPMDLPEPTRLRLVETAARAPILKDGALDREAFVTRVTESAASELAYLQSVGGLGSIRGMGGSATAEADPEKTTAKLQDAFGRLGLSESAAKVAAAGRR